MNKVLIVDDKENNLFVLENLLKRLDVQIVKATNGDEALRATLNNEFALAILDVQMPIMDGYELANLLRSDDRTKNIPIIFLSAVYSEDYYVFKGYEAGAVDFITKPFNPEVLLSKVSVFLKLNEQKTDLVEHRKRLEDTVSQLEEQVEARRKAEEQVRKANDFLEERVRERTAEIIQADKQLRAQAAALEKQNQQLLSAILELSRTQEALAESEERYRIMGDTIPYGVWMCDEKGRAEYVSPSFLDLLGLSLDEMKRAGWTERVISSGMGSSNKEWLDCVCTGQPAEGEQKITDRHGKVHTVLTRGLPIRGENGEIKKWVGIHLDITERKQLEETLLLNEARLEALFEVNQMMDLPRHEIAEYAINRLLSLTNSEMASLEFLEDETDSEDLSLSNSVNPKYSGGEVSELFNSESAAICNHALLEKRAVMINDFGSRAWGNQSSNPGHPALNRILCVPAFDRGRVVALGVVGNKPNDYDHSDVRQMSLLIEGIWKHVERLRAERERAQYVQRLEKLNQELQDFAYIASHDLQEPLRKIQAFGDRLRSKCVAKLDETEIDYLVRMEGAANRMQDLIRDLLKYSRVSTKPEPFKIVDLNDILMEVVQIFEFRLRQSNGKIEVAELPVVEADPTQMKQLFQNLIGNSLKFQKEGATPLIKVFSNCGKENTCRIFIEDNGIGFDERYASKIFSPFQRLHTRMQYEGTGMGLAICRKIVDRHGGDIAVKSQPEAGTTFIIDLPIKQS